ncbi:hypothetical protein BV20DRAFT_978189 [Pilatotrama ljubarskyi]|nr:hypothetical protein BV20DRAFT_978189 [Pilatotrama ljubarskyi]
MDMDAVDVAWCLSCECRIELEPYRDGYCSPECAPPSASSSSVFQPRVSSQKVSPYSSVRDSRSRNMHHIEDCPSDAHLPSTLSNSWIGGGSEGIKAWARSVSPGAPQADDESSTFIARPPILDRLAGRVKPSLCMCRAQPAPPEPSRPILTPQQSLPSLSRDSTSMNSTSVVSLTTDSSYSLATPATGSVVGSLAVIDTARIAGGKPGLLRGLKEHLRAFSSTTSLKEQRSTTVTRRDAIADSAASRAQKTRRAPSPVSFYHMPEEYLPPKRKEGGVKPTMKENAHPAAASRRTTAAPEDHPAFRARGRKPSRYPS